MDSAANGSSAAELQKMPKLQVSEFYRNAVVLITGGTGFMGKVLVEKLLRSFDVKKIYLLMREKRNVRPAERLRQIVKDPIFDTIRKSIIHHETLFAKLEAIEADFTVDQFVKEPYKTDLLNNTQIVFHVMGSISFSDSLQSILKVNVDSTERLYNFIREGKQLQSIVHVSTLYANCDRSHIEETVYDDVPFGGLENVRRILEHLSESEMAALTPTIIGPMPNTYVFSKKCAEVMIQQQHPDLPIGIFRPPIVCPSYREPVPGWVDCLHGATGLCIPILKQRLVWYYGDDSMTPSLVPVDYCIAAMITAACDIRARYDGNRALESLDKRLPSVPVYNLFFDKNPVTWRQFVSLVGSGLPSAIARRLNPFKVRVTGWRILSRITFWLLYLQAHVVDFVLGSIGKPKCNVRAIASLDGLSDLLEYFRCRTWTAGNDNIKRMRSLLSKQDEHLLEFDVDQIDWKDYYKHFTAGLFVDLARREERRRIRNKVDC